MNRNSENVKLRCKLHEAQTFPSSEVCGLLVCNVNFEKKKWQNIVSKSAYVNGKVVPA